MWSWCLTRREQRPAHTPRPSGGFNPDPANGLLARDPPHPRPVDGDSHRPAARARHGLTGRRPVSGPGSLGGLPAAEGGEDRPPDTGPRSRSRQQPHLQPTRSTHNVRARVALPPCGVPVLVSLVMPCSDSTPDFRNALTSPRTRLSAMRLLARASLPAPRMPHPAMKRLTRTETAITPKPSGAAARLTSADFAGGAAA
jgi:hypothetical protein